MTSYTIRLAGRETPVTISFPAGYVLGRAEAARDDAAAFAETASDSAGAASTNADRAEGARDAALAAGVPYANAAAFIAGTSNGDKGAYWDNGEIVLAENVSGVATPIDAPWLAGDKVSADRQGTVQAALDRAEGASLGRLRGGELLDFTSSASSPEPIQTIGDALYGYHNLNLYAKTTRNGAWSVVTSVPVLPVRLQLMSDGEVVLVGSRYIYKSSGWGTGTVVWTQKVDNGDNLANFLNFSSAGSDGVKMLVGAYAGNLDTGGGPDSRYVWGTVDSGDTWAIIWDSAALFPTEYTTTHIHGCCYDAVQDLWFVIEGHSSSRGIYYADATVSSPTWTRIEKGEFGQNREDGQPTNIVPTPSGIVCASDSPDQGLWVVERGNTPTDMRIEYLLPWVQGENAIAGFGQSHAIDPVTGIVYIGMRSNGIPLAYNPLTIFASNGSKGIVAWQGDSNTVPAENNNNAFSRVIVTPWRTVMAKTFSSSEVGNKIIELEIHNGGDIAVERGNIHGGRADGSFTMAVGASSLAEGIFSSAIGNAASSTADNSTAVGSRVIVDGVNSTVIGANVTTSANSTFLAGPNINAGNNSVVIGSNRDLSALAAVISIGASQTVSVSSAVAIGQATTVTGAAASAVGSNSVASGSLSSAFGNQAQATGANSATFGHQSQATGSGSAAFGQTAKATGNFSFAFGRAVTAAGNSVVIGNGRDLSAITGVVSVGSAQTVSGNSAVAVGHNVTVSGLNGTAVGQSSQATSSTSTAIGSTANAGHVNSVALGAGSTTTANNQIAAGARAVTLLEMTEPSAAPAEGAHLFLKDDGAGKTQLCVRFQSGASIVLATEA